MSHTTRALAQSVFNEHLNVFMEYGGTAFRRTVINTIKQISGCTEAAASTHYNTALRDAKKIMPFVVAGLGREESKKGGRKVRYPVNVVSIDTMEVIAERISRTKANELINKDHGVNRYAIVAVDNTVISPTNTVTITSVGVNTDVGPHITDTTTVSV